MILVYLIPLAILAGYLTGGSLRHYAAKPLAWVALPVAAFAIEAALGYLPGLLGLPARTCLFIFVPLEYALLLAFCVLNIRRAGMPLLLAGVLLNLAVISLNGFRMPVSEAALTIPSLMTTAARIESGELIEYVLASPDAPLYFLGDVIAVPFLPGGLASIGDAVLGGGVVWLLLGLMRKPKTAPSGNDPDAARKMAS